MLSFSARMWCFTHVLSWAHRKEGASSRAFGQGDLWIEWLRLGLWVIKKTETRRIQISQIHTCKCSIKDIVDVEMSPRRPNLSWHLVVTSLLGFSRRWDSMSFISSSITCRRREASIQSEMSRGHRFCGFVRSCLRRVAKQLFALSEDKFEDSMRDCFNLGMF